MKKFIVLLIIGMMSIMLFSGCEYMRKRVDIGTGPAIESNDTTMEDR